MSNPFQLIPLKYRVAIYAAYVLAGCAISSIGVYCSTTGIDQPGWVAGVAAVLIGPIAALFGFTAVSNAGKADGSGAGQAGELPDPYGD